MLILERWEINKISLTTAPACFLEKVLKLPHRGGIRQNSVLFLSSGNGAKNQERPKHLEFTGYQRLELYRERIAEICRGSTLSIQLGTNHLMQVRNLAKARERTTQKDLRE